MQPIPMPDINANQNPIRMIAAVIGSGSSKRRVNTLIAKSKRTVVYRPLSRDIVFARFNTTDKGLMIMQGEPTIVTYECVIAVAKEMYDLNTNEGKDHIVVIKGKHYRMVLQPYDPKEDENNENGND